MDLIFSEGDRNALKKTVFLGAGASSVFGIPTVRDFLNDFESFLNKSNDYSNYAKLELYNDIKKYLGDKDEFDLESMLTVLMRFCKVVGSWTISENPVKTR